MKDCEEGEKGEMCGGGREGREEERRGHGGRGPCTTRSRHYDFLRAPGRDMSSSIALPSGAARCYHGCETGAPTEADQPRSS